METTALNDARPIQPAAQDASAQAPRNPWFAAALSLLSLGVGHVYCGRITVGLVLFSLWIIHLPLLALLAWLPPSRPALIFLLAAPIALHGVLYFTAAIHAFAVARRTAEYRLRDYNRPLVYLALVLLGMSYPLLIAVTIRDNLFEAFVVPTNSMTPTINVNERVLCNKSRFLTSPIQRGDLVVFQPPGESPTLKFVKRVIAVGGDKVTIVDGRVTLNGKSLDYQPLESGELAAQMDRLQTGAQAFVETINGVEHVVGLNDAAAPNPALPHTSLIVPEGQFFVLGEFRSISRDSRSFGPIEQSQIVGRLEYCYFPSHWSRFGPVR